jgi:diphosphomevalonate decarboxylase
MIKYEASAPSNIALIKYMGKTDASSQRPTNSSLSYTLNQLKSFVRVTHDPSLTQDTWAPLAGDFSPFEMSEHGRNRFIKHFQNIKKKWGITDFFLIESANNFPSDCGLASSASSFAALTKAASGAFNLIHEKPDITEIELSDWSRQGSGSSCRSFFGPFSLWYPDGVRPLEFQMGPWVHQVVVVDDHIKEVSSSEAHKRVISSPLFGDRPVRAERRLAELISALKQNDWGQICQICWSEFWDMHALFETSSPRFGYMNAGTMEVLDASKAIWKAQNDGPLVTMDAGANVHFLWREDQSALAKELEAILSKKLQNKFKIMGSHDS